MNRSVRILSVPHWLQGERFVGGYVPDPCYEALVDELIAESDFVFEEASGQSQSIAEVRSNCLLGSGHYMDVDPPPFERQQHGIAAKPYKDCFICEPVPVSYHEQILEEHEKREQLWLDRLRSTSFENGLIVCGSAHGLSFAFRVKAAGFSEVRLYEYLPK